MDFFAPPSTSTPPTTMHDIEAHTLTQDESLCTEQDLARQRFSSMSMPDTQDQLMRTKIDNISSNMQDLVYEINESRTNELKMMDSFKDMIMSKVTDVCEEMKEHMYAVYEGNSHAMKVKLEEVQEVLESCSKLNEELQGASQALASLKKVLDLSLHVLPVSPRVDTLTKTCRGRQFSDQD